MILTLGLNHHSAPLAFREQLAFQAEALPQALGQLMADGQVREAAILSTCNRTEIYCTVDSEASAATVAVWMANSRQVQAGELGAHLYTYADEAAVRHAFRVASGLDSMVIGEPQILGQMKEAIRVAEGAGALGTQLHKLFQRAFSVAKEVRSTTAIGANVVSMAAAAVHLAERIFESIEGQRVLFVGAGEMIELCATHFAARQPRQLSIANRTFEKAAALAARFKGSAIRLDELAAQLPNFDIVVLCTASPLPIVGLGMVERAVKVRRHRPIFMVDLAVPRDVEVEVGKLDDIFLYTVDDLAQVVESGLESRQAAVLEAEEIIGLRVTEYFQWLEGRDAVPLIRALRDSAERARRHELEHAAKLLARGEAVDQVLEQMSQRLMNKFLHAPTQTLSLAEGEDRQSLQGAAQRLFHLHPDNAP